MKSAIIFIALVVAVAADLQQPMEQRKGEQGQRKWQSQGVDSNIGQQHQRPLAPGRFRRAIDKEGVKDSLNRGVDKATQAGQNIQQGFHDAKENVRRTRDTVSQGLKDTFNRGVEAGKAAGQDVKQGFKDAKEDVRRARDTLGGQGLGRGLQQGFEQSQGLDQGKVLGQTHGLDTQQNVRRPKAMQRIVDIGEKRKPRAMVRTVEIKQPREFMFSEY